MSKKTKHDYSSCLERFNESKLNQLDLPTSARIFRQLRLQLRLTQVQIAKVFDMSVSGIQNWENGRRKIPVKIAKKLLTLTRSTYNLDDFYSDT